MAKDKEKKFNPVAEHKKTEKNKAIKKNKANVTAQRNERLVHRNPLRLQQQIDEMKATQEAQGGELRPRDRELLQKLEREVKSIHKAREVAGIVDKGTLGKRRREDGDGDRHNPNRDELGAGRGPRSGWKNTRDESPPTDEDVRGIPMPRDTPPPIPYRTPSTTQQPAQRAVSAAPAKTVYSAAPQVRNLQKEATSKFVPAAVAAKLKALKGEVAPGGRYLEPEEVDALEAAGYSQSAAAAVDAAPLIAPERGEDDVTRLNAEELAFERELAHATMKKGGELIVEEAEKEAQFLMMADGNDGTNMADKAQMYLKRVELEEVDDEDG